MPIPCPHFKITIVKRSQGQSAVAGAAYQSGERLFSEYDQKTKFYNKKKELVHAEIMLPSHAPPGYADRATLWNAVEAVENQWNSQLARRIVLAFPVEVPKEQYLKMIREFCQEQFVSKGMIPKEQIITRRYEREVVERKNHLQTIQVERDKAQKDLISLKAEILACIKGESVFPKETLAEMITAQEEKLRELDALYESSYAETEKTAELMDNVSKLYEELISFSDLYDSASFEAKKMIVNQLIRRVDVYRGYQLNITP